MTSPARLNVVIALKQAFIPLFSPDEHIERLVTRWPDLSIRSVSFHPQHIDAIEQADVLYSYTITPEILAAAQRLRWFHAIITGPDAYDFPELRRREVTVTSPRGVTAKPIAEWVVGVMLALSRRLPHALRLQAEKTWGGQALVQLPPPRELSDMTVLIIGMGGIGSEVAVKCRALGMRIIAVVPRDGQRVDNADEVIAFREFRGVLGRADAIVLACPLTPETRAMIGAPELAAMKPTALLINPARGALVDESALARALQEGTIAGAAADAFSVEPLPAGNPLYAAPNMIVTPHIAGFSERFWGRSFERFEENLRRFCAGEELIGVVDFKRGY